MQGKILKYQKAFNDVIKKINKNNGILAVMAFGSVLTGDLWEDSDIDMVAIVQGELEDRKNIYLTENNITVHIRVIRKQEFVEFNKYNLRGGKMHRILISSRLIFSKDADITNTFNSFKYYPEQDKEKWNLVYLSKLLKSIGVCKKYLQNKRQYTAYENAINIIKDFSMLFLNYNGYLVSKDATTMAVDLNEEFRVNVDNLIKEKGEDAILEIIRYVEKYIDTNLKSITKILLEFLKEEKDEFSVEEVENHIIFKEFSMDLQQLLDLLSKEELIKKDRRKLLFIDKETEIRENVYGAIR